MNTFHLILSDVCKKSYLNDSQNETRDVHGSAAAAAFFSRTLKKCMNLIEF